MAPLSHFGVLTVLCVGGWPYVEAFRDGLSTKWFIRHVQGYNDGLLAEVAHGPGLLAGSDR
jgi:hypothetical protein